MRISLILLLLLFVVCETSMGKSFVERGKDGLMLHGKSFSFSGANIYWLGLDENVPPGVVAYPTKFRQMDALATAAVMGATVVRAHTLGISVGHPLSFCPSLGVFNDGAFLAADRAVALASAFNIRLIVPLTDNYNYYHGGRFVFCDWFHKDNCDEFFSNETIISSFESYIKHVLHHKNAFTGVPNAQNPSIMAWETGNELRLSSDQPPPVAWTSRISAFIKKHAPNQLVVDGTYGINKEVANVATIDLVSDHFYPPRISPIFVQADALLAQQMGKVFLAGEYQWNHNDDLDALQTFLDALNSTRTSSCFWSLFEHRDEDPAWGFVVHNDCCTLHYPGPSGSYMRSAVKALLQHAMAMGGGNFSTAVLTPPTITYSSNSTLTWLGAAGADFYVVLVANTPTGPWIPLGGNTSDFTLPFTNNGLRPGLFTRVVPYSLSRVPVAGPPSQVVQLS